jgi:hypothetical protein
VANRARGAGAGDLLSILLGIMAHQPSPSVVVPVSRPSLVDLICVVVLSALLWVGAQAIGGVARASTLHAPVAADCGPGQTPPAPAREAGPMASLALGDCGDKPAAPAAH